MQTGDRAADHCAKLKTQKIITTLREKRPKIIKPKREVQTTRPRCSKGKSLLGKRPAIHQTMRKWNRNCSKHLLNCEKCKFWPNLIRRRSSSSRRSWTQHVAIWKQLWKSIRVWNAITTRSATTPNETTKNTIKFWKWKQVLKHRFSNSKRKRKKPKAIIQSAKQSWPKNRVKIERIQLKFSGWFAS